jgi:hypothetical protein
MWLSFDVYAGRMTTAAMPKYGFNAWSIAGAPDDSGVYVLWEREELLYVGRALRIRTQLLEHYARRVAPHDATHYGWELARFPTMREAELLRGWKSLTGKLPRYNAAA